MKVAYFELHCSITKPSLHENGSACTRIHADSKCGIIYIRIETDFRMFPMSSPTDFVQSDICNFISKIFLLDLRKTQLRALCGTLWTTRSASFSYWFCLLAVRVCHVFCMSLQRTWTRGPCARREPWGCRVLHPERTQPAARHSSPSPLEVLRLHHHRVRQFRDPCSLPDCHLLTS